MKTEKEQNANVSFEKQLEKFEKQLKEIHSNEQSKGYNHSESMLKSIYEHYSKTFEMDNERIWKVGAIFIPLSLGPFVIFTQIENLTQIHVFMLGLTSVILIQFWNMIANKQRLFSEKSIEVLNKINSVYGLTQSVPDVGFSNKIKNKEGVKIWKLRKGLTIFITVLWIGIFLLALFFPKILSIKEPLF